MIANIKLDKIDKDLESLIEGFVYFLLNEKQASRHTIVSYVRDIKHFLCFLQSHIQSTDHMSSVRNLSVADIEQCNVTIMRNWLHARICQELCHRSNARAISALKSLFRYANETHNIDNQSIFHIQKPRLPKSLPKAINIDSVLKLLDSISNISKQTWHAKRDRAIVLIMFTAGLRISEALQLQIDSFNASYITIIGKGNKQRTVPITESVREEIKNYINTCPFHNQKSGCTNHLKGHLFFSNTGSIYSSRMMQRVLETARRKINLPEYVTPHSLRHSCATTLLNQSTQAGDLQKIQKLLGHVRISTTQIYTKIDKSSILDAIKKTEYYS